MHRLALLALTVLLLGASAPPPAGALSLKTERVVVFKDGYALFVKSATAVADARGEVFTTQVPEAAVLGSVWATAKGAEIRSLRAESTPSVTRDQTGFCLSVAEILRANVGRQVTLTLEKGAVTGKIVQLLELTPEPTPAAPGAPRHGGALATAPATERELTPRGGELVALDGTDQGRMALAVSAVKSVSGRELSLRCLRTFQSAEPGKRLTVDLGPAMAGKKVSLRLLYFTPGVRWIPTYRVRTGKGAKAEIALQGELLNEAEDIEGAEVSLVVGVPNFRFKTTVSPLALERTMRQALAQAAPNLMGSDQGRFSNALFTQRAGEWRGGAEDGAGGDPAALAPELGGAGESDLYVYGIKSLTLRRGERAVVPLWQAPAPQRHVYTFDVAVARRARGGEPVTPAGSPLRLEKNEVWHQLELTAGGAVPWTTGAALILKDELPLGQELLTYTPAGARTLLPITVAVDVRGQHQETEVERKPNALSIDGESFTLVRRKGSLKVTNHRAERASLRLSFASAGKLEQTSDDAQLRAGELPGADHASTRSAKANPWSTARWELELAPGQTRTVTYQLAVYE